MKTNSELAPAAARHDAPALSTRAARPAAGTDQPVVSLGDLTAAVREGNELLRQRTARQPAAAGDVLARARATLTRAANRTEEANRNTEAARELEARRERDARRGRDDVLDREQRARMDQDWAETGRLAELERRQAALEAENRRLRTLASRPPMASRAAASPAAQRDALRAEARAATLHHLRTGETVYKGRSISEYQQRMFKESTAADGGVLLLPEQDMGPIEKLLLQYTPMRRYAQVISINAYTYKKPMRKDPGGARWGDELSSGGSTTTPNFYMLDVPAHNLYAEPATSQDVLEDVSYDLEGELTQGSIDAFAIAESGAFVSGSGVEKPKGFLTYTNVSFASGTPSYDNIGYMPTGVSGDFHATAPGDALVKLPYKLLAGYRQNGKYMANRNTIAAMRTFKDSTGAYLWTQGNLTLGQPNTFSGYEVIEAEDMPDIAANSYSIAFSDFERSYVIVDRVGLSVLRDPYTQSPSIVFKTRKRVGGAVKNCRAIGLVKFAAS